MLIKGYGLFWRADEVNWKPGRGARDAFRLLGRRGKRAPNLSVVDIRHQQGIYILYGNHGPTYVGLTKQQGLGKRLSDHLSDSHAGEWDRFSWFGFCHISAPTEKHGLCEVKELASAKVIQPSGLISDVEALLIAAMGLNNVRQMKFHKAHEWIQVHKSEVDKYLKVVKP